MELEEGVPSTPSAGSDASDVINVLATTEQGTLVALQKAAAMARLRRSQVVVLVPDIVEYGVPLTKSNHDPAIITASYRDLAARVGLQVSVRVCPCREARHISGRLMLSNATIVLGGRRRSWRATAEQKLARWLSGEGHHVTFVDVDTGQSRDERVT